MPPNTGYPIDWREINLDPQFSDVFQPGVYPTAADYSALQGAGLGPQNPPPGMSRIPQAGSPPLTPQMLPGPPNMPQMIAQAARPATPVAVSQSPGIASILGPLAAAPIVAGAGYGLYNALKNPGESRGQNALQAGVAGSILNPMLGVPAGLLGGLLGGRTHPEQKDRERALASLGDLSQGLNSKNYNVANNSMDTPQGQVVGAVNPLAEILVSKENQGDYSNQDNNKRRSDLAGILANYALSSGDPMAAIRQKYEQAGLDRSSAYQDILELRKSGQIESDADRDAALAAIDKLFGVVNNGPSSKPVGNTLSPTSKPLSSFQNARPI